MTEAERQAIEWACSRLVAQAANLTDEHRWDDLVALFADYATMARPSAPDEIIAGRAAISAAFKSRPPRTTRHLCGNIVIDVEDAANARGTCAMALYTGGTGPLVGSFHDRFVLTADGWRFGERRGTLTFGA